MFEYRHFTLNENGDVWVVHLVDPRIFDTLIVSELEDELLDFIEMRSPQKVIIDFDGVTNCSTSVINGLLRAKKRLVSRKGQLALCGMADAIREAYRVLNLDGTVFKIYGDLPKTLAAL